MRARLIRQWIAKVRWLPLHPQWLLQLSGSERALRESFSGMRGCVLDIGCAGRQTAQLLPQGCDYIGLDYPDTAVSLYETRPDVFADARGLPFPSASFQGVILKDVLEHVPAPERVLAEIGRVLSEGGILVLWMPFIYPIHDAPYDFQRYTEHGLRRYLTEHGMHVTELVAVLSPVETASLMLCLASADAAEQILVRRRWLLPLIPLLALLVLMANLMGIALAWLPATRFMPSSYRLVAVREKHA